MVNVASKFKVMLISENVIASTIRYISSRHTQKGLKMYEEVMKGYYTIQSLPNNFMLYRRNLYTNSL